MPEKVKGELRLPEAEMEPVREGESEAARIAENAQTLRGAARREFERFSEILQYGAHAISHVEHGGVDYKCCDAITGLIYFNPRNYFPVYTKGRILRQFPCRY